MGQVTVNGRPATAGQQIDPDGDRVVVRGRVLRLPREHTYLMLNKPPGIVTTAQDEHGRPTVVDRVAARGRLYPVGRLDLRSRGLILMTDDGDLAARLLHPRYHVDKEYRVRITGRPRAEALRRLREGIRLQVERFAPVQVRILRSNPGQTELSMVLHEGRKREIRRMWAALGHRVDDLARVRIGPLRLGGLGSGESRRLRPQEVQALRRSVGLT